MPMPLEKAKHIIKEYKKAGFNATKGLVNAGYKESTATKQSKAVINSALNKVITEETKEVVNSSISPRNKLLQLVKITEDQLMNEYMKIVLQDKDFTNKLKAMLPLLKTQGIVWEDNQTTVNPTLNLTVKTNTPLSNHAQNHANTMSDTSSGVNLVLDNVKEVSSNDVTEAQHEVEQVSSDVPASFMESVDHVSSDPSQVDNTVEHEVGHVSSDPTAPASTA